MAPATEAAATMVALGALKVGWLEAMVETAVAMGPPAKVSIDKGGHRVLLD